VAPERVHSSTVSARPSPGRPPTTTLVRELRPWGYSQFVRRIVPWGRGVLVSNGATSIAFDEHGERRFEIPGEDLFVANSKVLAIVERKALVFDECGNRKHELDTGKIGRGAGAEGRAAVVIGGDHVYLATRWPSAAACCKGRGAAPKPWPAFTAR
jgi:hypothetical protein